MRGFDCPGEDKEHVHGRTDADLLQEARSHRDKNHPEMDDAQLKAALAGSTYDCAD